MYTVSIFMKCTHICVAQTTYQFFTNLLIEPDSPCLADEIAEPRPDIDIKVAAFTVSENAINNKNARFLYACQAFRSRLAVPALNIRRARPGSKLFAKIASQDDQQKTKEGNITQP